MRQDGVASSFPGSIGRQASSNRNVKPIVSGGAAVAALLLLYNPAAGQQVVQGGLSSAAVARQMNQARSNVVGVPSIPGTWTNWVRGPAGWPDFKVRPLRQPAPLYAPFTPHIAPPAVQGLVLSNRVGGPNHPAPVPPGVCETAPYSCIVVVPGPHPDDCCILNPGGGSPMPIIRPDLQFIPRGQAKK